MEITLNRTKQWPHATTGEMAVDGVFECFTLEDIVRPDPDPATPENEAKVFAETAIPAGRYAVTWEFSPKFKKFYPRLQGVPGFTGILIHSGNTHEDTMGCILVGKEITSDGQIATGTSRIAFTILAEKVRAARQKGEAVWITITDWFKAGMP